MSKRKNPLNNLEDFLRQEASSFVTPKKLKGEASATETAKATPAISNESTEVTTEKIAEMIGRLAEQNNKPIKKQLLELVKIILEKEGLDESRDKMLINTILFIENDQDWRNAVQSYWERYAS